MDGVLALGWSIYNTIVQNRSKHADLIETRWNTYLARLGVFNFASDDPLNPLDSANLFFYLGIANIDGEATIEDLAEAVQNYLEKQEKPLVTSPELYGTFRSI
jgi:hypothetical protein